MTTETDIGTLITRTPGLHGGRPHIAGAGVTVGRIVTWYKLGFPPEEIHDQMGHPTLSLAQIYAALTYYHANRDEIEKDLREDEAEAVALMDQSQDARTESAGIPPPLTPDRVRLARERVAAIRERIRRRGVDLTQMPDPVEELSKARAAGGWE